MVMHVISDSFAVAFAIGCVVLICNSSKLLGNRIARFLALGCAYGGLLRVLSLTGHLFGWPRSLPEIELGAITWFLIFHGLMEFNFIIRKYIKSNGVQKPVGK